MSASAAGHALRPRNGPVLLARQLGKQTNSLPACVLQRRECALFAWESALNVLPVHAAAHHAANPSCSNHSCRAPMNT